MYVDIVKNLSDTLPSSPAAHLLGISYTAKKDSGPLYSWYRRFVAVQNKATTLAKLVPSFQSELYELLISLISLHEQLNALFAKWSSISNVEHRKLATIRKVILIDHFMIVQN